MKESPRSEAARQANPTVAVALEALGELKHHLHQWVVAAGLQVLHALLEADRDELCGPPYRHDERRATQHRGHPRKPMREYAAGEVALELAPGRLGRPTPSSASRPGASCG